MNIDLLVLKLFFKIPTEKPLFLFVEFKPSS